MKKDNKDKAPRKDKKPFFARLLEEQEMEQVAGGTGGIQTRRYPSDQDTCGGPVVTLKFPSDKDDDGGGGPVTLKYPSDTDEGGAY